MSAYTVTLTEAELAVVALALGRMLSPKLVKPRAVAATPLEISTGNDALDAFMRKSWRASDTVKAAARAAAHVVKPTPLKPKKWSVADHVAVAEFNEAAVDAWRRLGHEVIVSGRGGMDRNGANVTILALGATA